MVFAPQNPLGVAIQNKFRTGLGEFKKSLKRIIKSPGPRVLVDGHAGEQQLCEFSPPFRRSAPWRSCAVQINTIAGKYGSLRFGVGAGVCQKNLVVIVSSYNLADQAGNRTLWKDADAGLLGSSELEERVSRLADGLVENLQMALSSFYKAIEG